MFTHLHAWDNKFVLICLFLHQIQHIHYKLLCLAFQQASVKSGVTKPYPTSSLANDVSFQHENIHKTP